MPTEAAASQSESSPRFVDQGLLSPVSVAVDRLPLLDDATLARALVASEIALTRAWEAVGVAPAGVAATVSAVFGWRDGDGDSDSDIGADEVAGCDADDLTALTDAAVAGGNPVIPLVGMLRARVPEAVRGWIHRGATSQDIMDSALMLVARNAGLEMLAALVDVEETLARFAIEHRDVVAAGRTLTQHAVPTTVGARAAAWVRGVERAAYKLDEAIWQLPAQLGGAAGTLASFVQIGGEDAALALPARFADELGLAVPDAPWHTVRWPITELGDALVQATDALGVIAADVATLSRTEIAELAEGAGGGSSAMPQKQNPTRSVLIRSAALRAPQLAATLHTAAALAVDERPDGAWHAEWPVLRELMRLAAGAAQHAAHLVAGLAVDRARVAHNLGLSGGLIVAERLAIELGPLIGQARVKSIVGEAGAGADLEALLRAEPGLETVDIAALLAPANYLGLAGHLVDELIPEGVVDATESSASLSEEN